jgi:Secretion system C-terminal sorting domain
VPLEENSTLNLYPNPATTDIQIRMNAKAYPVKTMLIITDVNGKIVYTQETQRNQADILLKVNISGLRNGVYFVKINTDIDKFQTLRFVKY